MPAPTLTGPSEFFDDDNQEEANVESDADYTTVVNYISGIDFGDSIFLNPDQSGDIFKEFTYEIADSISSTPTEDNFEDSILSSTFGALLSAVTTSTTNDGADAPGGLSSGDLTLGKDTTTTEEESYIEYYNWSDAPIAPEIQVGESTINANVGAWVRPIIYSSTEKNRLIEKFSSTGNEAAGDFDAVLDQLLTDRSRIMIQTFNVKRNSFIKTKKYDTLSIKNFETL